MEEINFRLCTLWAEGSQSFMWMSEFPSLQERINWLLLSRPVPLSYCTGLVLREDWKVEGLRLKIERMVTEDEVTYQQNATFCVSEVVPIEVRGELEGMVDREPDE